MHWKIMLLLYLLISVTYADETVTEWEYRTVPTSTLIVEAFHCKNGRKMHVKGQGEHVRIWCPGPKVD